MPPQCSCACSPSNEAHQGVAPDLEAAHEAQSSGVGAHSHPHRCGTSPPRPPVWSSRYSSMEAVRRLNTAPARLRWPCASLKESLLSSWQLWLPLLLFSMIGIGYLVGWGLIVFGTFAKVSVDETRPPPLLLPQSCHGWGILLLVASLATSGAYLVSYIRNRLRPHAAPQASVLRGA
jgi:hypothetical protein